MNIKISLLERFIELPTHDTQELRQIFDDLGLEVKGVSGEGDTLEFTLETLAHRGDHLCALGIAREFAGRYLTPIKQPALGQLNDSKPSFIVKKLTDKCFRYGLMEMHFPERMALRADVARFMGEHKEERPAIVDLLNYIQMEIGQPMHVFDRDKIEGEISIVMSEAPEEIEALDGKTYTVPAGSILIRDRKKTIAVAGVIGCANSMASNTTTRALIESASFDPVCVRLTARGMGLSTDASYLYERGADLETPLTALRRLVYLTSGPSSKESAHILGYQMVGGTPEPAKKLTLKIADVRREVNLPRLNAIEIVSRLKSLGYIVEPVVAEKEYLVTVPSWRKWNVLQESAVIEDFVRAHGLNRVKLELPTVVPDYVEENPHEALLKRIEPVLLGNGFNEVMTKAYYSADDAKIISDIAPKLGAEHLLLANASDKSWSHLKVTNALHLANVIERNQRQGVTSCKVYEVSRLYNATPNPEGSTYEYERDILSIAASGRWYENDWRKGEDLESILKLFGGMLSSLANSLSGSFSVRECNNPLLHPGRRAALYIGRTECGFFGALHPDLLKRAGINREIVYAELDTEKLIKVATDMQYKKPSDFPTIKKDLTVKVPLKTWASKVSATIKSFNPDNLAKVDIVDEFKKENEDFKRVSYRMVFRNNERTLSHEEVDATFHSVINQLAEKGFELA